MDAARRSDHGWPRIGRQLYDIWALLGNDEVLTFLQDRVTAAAVLADCIRVSEDFAPDLPPPSGGFAACEALTVVQWPGGVCIESAVCSQLDEAGLNAYIAAAWHWSTD